MKFGAQLELHATPEWSDKYVRYRYLKSLLLRHVSRIKALGPEASYNVLRASLAPPTATSPRASPKATPLATALSGSTPQRPLPGDGVHASRSLVSAAQDTSLNYASVPLLPSASATSERRPASHQTKSDTSSAVSPRRMLSTNSSTGGVFVGCDDPSSPACNANREFLSELDTDVAGIEDHFRLQLALVLQRICGIEDELDTLDAEEEAERLKFQYPQDPSCVDYTEQEFEATAATNARILQIRHLVEAEGQVQHPGAVLSGTEESLGRATVDRKISTIWSRLGAWTSDDETDREQRREARDLERKIKQQQKERAARVKTRNSHRERLCRAVISVWDFLDRLEAFVQLNVIAIYKILKKRDKLLHLRRLDEDLTARRRRLGLLMIPQALKDVLLALYKSCTTKTLTAAELHGDTLGVSVNEAGGAAPLHLSSGPQDTASEMQALSLVVQRYFGLKHEQDGPSPWITFLLGVCSVMIINTVLVAAIPTSDQAAMEPVLLVLLPIFRLLLMITLLFWGAGGAICALEYYGVNYKFILDVDPKCRVNGMTTLSIASMLTAIWIVGFLLFLADLKFIHSGLWYWMHPLVVAFGFLALLCFPSKTFRYSYRRSILRVLGGTIRTGFFPRERITLVYNIVGDVLTSLAKPLLDLTYTTLFYSRLLLAPEMRSAHAATRLAALSATNVWAQPLITLLPYWIRCVQCVTRLVTEHGTTRAYILHLANIGKYVASILVIMTSSIPWEHTPLSIYASRLIFVFVYIFASLYCLIWDIFIDWGLMPDPDNFVRPNHRVMFPQWMYYGITLFNIVGRLIWALTLVPLNMISNYEINISVITLVISSVEILRRSAWLVLRLENEHLTNSSRYRAMLWVPKMVTANVLGYSDNPYIEEIQTIGRSYKSQQSAPCAPAMRCNMTQPSSLERSFEAATTRALVDDASSDFAQTRPT